MISKNLNPLFFSSDGISDISLKKEKIMNKPSINSLNNKLYQSTNNINNNNISKNLEISENKIKTNNNNSSNKNSNLKINKNNIILDDKVKQNKIIDQYKFQIQQLLNSLKIKDQEINSLKKDLHKAKLKNVKKCFDNLDIDGFGMKVLSEKKKKINKKFMTKKKEYKIQRLDKMIILKEDKTYNLNIEPRDFIEIFPTQKPPLKGQIIAQIQIEPLEKEKHIQNLDQFGIKGKDKSLSENDLEIEDRDSIEIFPTEKPPLQAQIINQMLIERMEVPDFLIQNIDNMMIKKGNKINGIDNNIIEQKDSIIIFSVEKKPLQAQRIEEMIIESNENKEILNTSNDKNFGKLISSLEHVPLNKSPLQLKNPEEMKNKYLKNNKIKNKNIKKFNNRKDDLKIEYIESINVCNIKYKPKSNYILNDYSSFSNNGNLSIKPTLKVQNLKNTPKNKKFSKTQKIEEISYKNNFNFNFVSPKPSILPVKKNSKINNDEKLKNFRGNNLNNTNKIINGIKNNSCIARRNNIIESNFKVIKIPKKIENNKKFNYINDYNEYENIKGRNVRIIKTQKHGPSIIEKKFIANSSEEGNNNYFIFKGNDDEKKNIHQISFKKV